MSCPYFICRCIVSKDFWEAISGGWGVVLATPVLVVLMTVVKELYTGNKEQPVTEEKEKPEKAKK